MGCKELIESLRKGADDRVRSIWQEAEQEAGKIKGEYSRKVDQLRQEYAEMQTSEAGTAASAIIFEAKNQVRMHSLTAEKRLSERLFALAASSLGRLRNEGYKEFFEATVRELPSLPWKTVRVNPEDIGLAKEYFPDVDVVPDESITGGVDVMTEAGKIRVINTFEKRLERAWVDMLSPCMKEIYEEAGK